MTLTQKLIDSIHAAFCGIRAQTQEPDEAEREIVRLAQERQWRVAHVTQLV
jgi:hypothetical protein